MRLPRHRAETKGHKTGSGNTENKSPAFSVIQTDKWTYMQPVDQCKAAAELTCWEETYQPTVRVMPSRNLRLAVKPKYS